MATQAGDKIIEALTQLMEAYQELQESVENELGETEEEEEDEDSDINSEVDLAIINELRASIEAVIDTEDFATEEIAAAISSLTEALEEIDPDVFESVTEEEEVVAVADEDDDYDYDGDDDIDYEDDDLDELDDEKEEEDE